MNFLSHFYFDRDTTNCYHTLGTVLPDLLKNADKTIIIHPEKFVHPDTRINDMILGWRKHLLVDRLFHSSVFFTTRSSELRKLLTPAVQGSPVKPFFLGHIALELILDNLLLTTDKVSVDIFYNHLRSCDPDTIKAFLNFSGLTETAKFFRFYDNFKKSRYLETYADTQQIAYALKRICMRIWHDPFTIDHEGRMNAVLSAYRDGLQDNFMSIFKEIDIKLKAET